MREPVSYRCDGCGVKSSNLGKWISVGCTTDTRFYVKLGCNDNRSVDDESAGTYCGANCALKAISALMARWSAQ